MENEYYSERVGGQPVREKPEVSAVFWAGLVSLVQSRSRDGWFAQRYPRHCFEAPIPIETDDDALGAAFAAHIPTIAWPLQSAPVPDTLAVLDAVEFFGRAVSKPMRKVYHEYGRHHHIVAFRQEDGFNEYRAEVNTMLRRSGHRYQLADTGDVQRIGPPILSDALNQPIVRSGDEALDRLLTVAVSKFSDPDIDVRREALEKLWDAWERLKTILPGDKKTSVMALLDLAVAEPSLRERIEKEAQELTSIGNAFMIRHSEVDKVPVVESDHVDYLFHRLFALVYMLLRAKQKASV